MSYTRKLKQKEIQEEKNVETKKKVNLILLNLKRLKYPLGHTTLLKKYIFLIFLLLNKKLHLEQS